MTLVEQFMLNYSNIYIKNKTESSYESLKNNSLIFVNVIYPYMHSLHNKVPELYAECITLIDLSGTLAPDGTTVRGKFLQKLFYNEHGFIHDLNEYDEPHAFITHWISIKDLEDKLALLNT